MQVMNILREHIEDENDLGVHIEEILADTSHAFGDEAVR